MVLQKIAQRLAIIRRSRAWPLIVAMVLCTACERGIPEWTIVIHNDTTQDVIIQEQLIFAPRALVQKKVTAGETLKLSEGSDLITLSQSQTDGSPVELTLNVLNTDGRNVRCLVTTYPHRQRNQPDVPIELHVSNAIPGPCPQPAGSWAYTPSPP